METIRSDERAAGLTAELLHRRRARDAVFEGYEAGFGEPAWDTLLLLYGAHARGEGAVSIGDVVEETHKSERMATAYVGWLETQDLARRTGDCVALTDRGRELMTRYLETIDTTGGRA